MGLGLSWFLKLISWTVVVVTIISNIYSYQFDRILGCKWHDEPNQHYHNHIKILAFGDPQITGSKESSLRKKLDVYGNDYFLGHIYNVLNSHLKPTHVAVMGDLISSQWIDDDEFYDRADRFKKRIFTNKSHQSIFVNISGNHDIGYNGEMTYNRVNRFENMYGKVNYVVENSIGTYDSRWRYIVINSLSLDGPAYEPQFQQDTLDFIKSIADTPFNGPTILFSHIPLYKETAICRDSTFFNYYSWGSLREQNHLSKETSDLLLNSIFKPGNPHGGVILTGHDHEGCITDYEYDTTTQEWLSRSAETAAAANNANAIREVTIRSMMGEYGGNGGLITGSFDPTQSTWHFSYSLCSHGIQHIWWTTKVLTYLLPLWISIIAFVH